MSTVTMSCEISQMVKRFAPGLARLPISASRAMITPEKGAVTDSFAAFPEALRSLREAVFTD